MQNQQFFKVDELPDNSSYSSNEPGTKKLTVVSCKEETNDKGTTSCVVSCAVDDNPKLVFRIYCPMFNNQTNKKYNFGLSRMKKIIKACDNKITTFSMSSLNKQLEHKSFNVYLTVNEKGYYELKDDDSIRPLGEQSLQEINDELEKKLDITEVDINVEKGTLQESTDSSNDINW